MGDLVLAVCKKCGEKKWLALIVDDAQALAAHRRVYLGLDAMIDEEVGDLADVEDVETVTWTKLKRMSARAIRRKLPMAVTIDGEPLCYLVVGIERKVEVRDGKANDF